MATSVVLNAGVWSRLQRLIVGMDNRNVAVGVFDDGEMATLAAHHEYGAPRAGIPERSFLRSTLRDDDGLIAQMLAKLTRRYFDGKMTLDQLLGMLGAFMQGAVKRRITVGPGIPPPLKPATIKRKGSTRPLVDTGRLLHSITWRIIP